MSRDLVTLWESGGKRFDLTKPPQSTPTQLDAALARAKANAPKAETATEPAQPAREPPPKPRRGRPPGKSKESTEATRAAFETWCHSMRGQPMTTGRT